MPREPRRATSRSGPLYPSVIQLKTSAPGTSPAGAVSDESSPCYAAILTLPLHGLEALAVAIATPANSHTFAAQADTDRRSPLSVEPNRWMDGSHVRGYLAQEVKALIATYRQFETLVPHPARRGASHPGEDGRYVESLVRSCLRKFLPRDLDISSGFILRPAVKTGTDGQERRGERDQTSTQLDVLVFDAAHYPPFQRFDNAVIVPPEGVVGIISVKKTLRPSDVRTECGNLLSAAEYCRTLDANGKARRGPFLALIGMDCPQDLSAKNMPDSIFAKISSAYEQNPEPFFDELVGFVGVIARGSAFKTRPSGSARAARFVWHTYNEDEEHLALQFLITGISSVYYDPTRSHLRRPGYTAFASGRAHDKTLGNISVSGLRWSS